MRIKLKSIIILTFLLFIVGACKKENNYRNKFVGDYQFTSEVYSWDDAWGSGSYTDVDTGRIELFKGYSGNNHDVRHKIDIILNNDPAITAFYAKSCFEDLSYGYGNYLHPTVNRKGVLEYPEYECFQWGYRSYFSGMISGDSIYMSYGYHDAVSQVDYVIHGKKITL